jgi:hypothetical protein
LSASSIARAPHVHAEVIKAWADGAVVQFQFYATKEWADDLAPQFHVEREYRVKPAKVYPVAQMNDDAICSAYYSGGSVIGPVAELAAFYRVANAALRHAIDAGQVITALDHNNALAALDVSLTAARDAVFKEGLRNSARDMAIAKAVRSESMRAARLRFAHKAEGDIECLDLAAIIAKVAP